MNNLKVVFPDDLLARGEVDDQEWRFLLTGGVALENPFSNPATDWLTDKSWSEIVRCSQLSAFVGFMDNFQQQVTIHICPLEKNES